jgi:hypothetical protein
MAVSERNVTSAVHIRPGASKVVFNGDGTTMKAPFLCVVATQPESPDDGGSQAPLATMEIGEGSVIRAEFDLREVATVSVPSTQFSITVLNRNEPRQPALDAWAYGCRGRPFTGNTRTFDVVTGMEQPNIRVPTFAEAFSYDLSGQGPEDYLALLSDSATGETYGFAAPGVRYPVTRRTRFVRFMDLPQGAGGQLTFFLRL